MRLEWILLAEGIGNNASGAITAISINQNVFMAARLPAVTKRAVLVHFVADPAEADELSGKEIELSAQVVDPSGHTIVAATVPGVFPPRLWTDLPGGLDISTEIPIRVTSYGTYELRISARAPGQPDVSATTYLYVREPIDLGPSS